MTQAYTIKEVENLREKKEKIVILSVTIGFVVVFSACFGGLFYLFRQSDTDNTIAALSNTPETNSNTRIGLGDSSSNGPIDTIDIDIKSDSDHDLDSEPDTDKELERSILKVIESLSLHNVGIEQNTAVDNQIVDGIPSPDKLEISVKSDSFSPRVAGISSPVNSCFIHSMIQMLYHCSSFRSALSNFFNLNPNCTNAAAYDLSKVFSSLDAAQSGGMVKFDFGISEPGSSNDNLMKVLADNQIDYGKLSKFIADEKLDKADMTLKQAYDLIKTKFDLKPKQMKLIGNSLIKHLKKLKQSDAINVQAAIPESLKTGGLNNPIALLKFYQSFLNLDAFKLNECVCRSGTSDIINEVPTYVLNLFFPSTEEINIKMANLVNFRYSPSRNAVPEDGSVIKKSYRIKEPLPDNIIVKVKRGISSDGTKNKNTSNIKDPESIDLSPYLRDSTIRENSKYNLISFTVRVNDHRYIVVKGSNDKWNRIDDEVVTVLDHPAMLNEAKKGYIYMYKKENKEESI